MAVGEQFHDAIDRALANARHFGRPYYVFANQGGSGGWFVETRCPAELARKDDVLVVDAGEVFETPPRLAALLLVVPPIEHRTRIRCTYMGEEDPNPIPVGTLGTVIRAEVVAGAFYQVAVAWDNGRSLSLVLPVDSFEVVKEVEDVD